MSDKPANMLEALGTEYREAPEDVKDSAELLCMAIYADLRKETGSERQHIARILHVALMQTQNAVFRMAKGMTESAFVDGLANYITQSLAIGPHEMQERLMPDLLTRKHSRGAATHCRTRRPADPTGALMTTAVKFATTLDHVVREDQLGATVLKASGVSLQVCAHGTTYLNFHDENNAIFAMASMPPKAAATLLLDGTEQLDARVAGLEQIVRPN